MMMANPLFRFSLLLVVLLTLGSCLPAGAPGKIPVARVGDEILYLTEIAGVIPANTLYDDSLLMAEDYIQKWIRRELLLKKAEENLTLQQRDVSQELEDYRNSLIIYRYQQELMRQKMDTVVSSQQLTDFYKDSGGTLTLDEALVKAVFVQIPVQVSNPGQVKAFCENPTPQNLKELETFCAKYAIGYEVHTENWTDLRSLAGRIPGFPDDPGTFLERGTTWESKDREHYYYLFVYEYRLQGDTAPAEYISESLRNLILNKRKIDFLKKLEDDVYTEGVRNQKFRLYEGEN